MSELAQEGCAACRKGAPKATPAEIAELRRQIPEWTIYEVGGIPRLERIFRFQNFKTALAFTLRVGDLAEAEGHHPALLTEWGKVTVMWWTHAIAGLHHNDFVMAAKTDRLAAELAERADQMPGDRRATFAEHAPE